MYACSPRWPADWISHEDLEAVLKGLAGKIEPSPWGAGMMSLNHGLHFTGGEPFLNFELLCEGVEIARALKIPSLFVESNCYWARTDGETRHKLETLKSLGIVGILISINPFYLEHVPFERSERAVRIAQEVFGRNVAVYQLEYYRMFQRLGLRGRLPLRKFLEIEKDFARNAEFFINGRAPYRIEAYDIFPRYRARTVCGHPCSPSFLRSWHNHFDNYGNYMPGYCGGLSLGDCRKLNELLAGGIDRHSHPIIGYITDDDFEDLLAFAVERGYEADREGYLSKCHLCADIRKFLVKQGKYPELVPEIFYEHLYDSPSEAESGVVRGGE
jgi:hypothetical protein